MPAAPPSAAPPSAAPPSDDPPVLAVRGLKTYFHAGDGIVKAVDGIDLTVRPGRTLGLVGESGSGKSVTSLSVMRLLPDRAAEIAGGSIALLGRDVVTLPEREMRRVRGRDAAMIFQEPGTSLNPVYRVGAQVAEAIRLHQDVGRDEARRRTVELFREVGIPDPERRVDTYPHEMSGGQKQRVMIAMALSCNPRLLIADEPTTALDVTIQAQILDLIRRLRDERGMAVLFITHDLGVIAEIADDVAVMLRGKIVETGPVERIFADPRHPYTKGLLACRPRLDTPFRRLPTVADFMTLSTDAAGAVHVAERPLDAARMAALTGRGRGRLLSPGGSRGQGPGARGNGPEGRLDGLPLDPGPLTLDQTVPPGAAPLLSVRDLKVHYPIRKGVFAQVTDHVRAVDGIGFDVYRGQTLGAGRRERLRQDDGRAGDPAAGPDHRRPRRLRRRRAVGPLRPAAAGTATEDPDRLPGPVQQPQPADDRRGGADRADGRPRPARRPGRAPRPRGGAAQGGRAAAGAPAALPARVQRRPAAAGRHRAGARGRARSSSSATRASRRWT